MYNVVRWKVDSKVIRLPASLLFKGRQAEGGTLETPFLSESFAKELPLFADNNTIRHFKSPPGGDSDSDLSAS